MMSNNISGSANNHVEQYFTFSLGGEEYGVTILSVVEVKVWDDEVTVLPNTANYVKGVLNLRGNIVPIIDMRLYYGLESSEYTSETVILVLNLTATGTDQMLGLVVDSVSDVMHIPDKHIHNIGEFDLIASTQTDSISGVATLEDHNIILLNPSTLVSKAQLKDISQLVSQEQSPGQDEKLN